MLNLENLKKQAKQYLRWHRERYYPVAPVIRKHLPRFRVCSDEAILTAEFRLVDAQELVAREHGFEGWQALRTGAHTMSHPAKEQSVRPVLTSIAPLLFVRDIEASCEFFTRRLGFTVDFIYGDPPYYAEVSRDNAKLALRHVDGEIFVAGIREEEHLLSAAITVASAEEIKSLFLIYQNAGVPFSQGLQKEPWGAKTFIVRDPDGNLVLFAGPDS